MKWLLKFKIEKNCAKYRKKKSKQKLSNKNLNYLQFSKVCFFFIFLKLFVEGLNFTFTKEKSFLFQVQSHANEITIKIQGTGDQYAVSENFYKCPDSIYLNTDLISPKGDNCKIINIPSGGETINTVKLKWNNKLISLQGMFIGFNHLKEADLSNFDCSSVSLMTDMFFNCSTVTSINFTNLDTSFVKDMRSVFYECESLTELNLSSFDTSKVTAMSFMFKGCRNLRSLNIESFKTSQVETMEALFADLYVLENLDVSHFDTS